jgi:polar amino acid transport system permease protein
VVLPQATRVIVPLLTNEATGLIKNTSLAMAIGVVEMTYQYKNIDNFMFRGVEALTAITVIYLVLCLATSGVGALLSWHLSKHARGRATRRPVLTSE